MTSRVPVEERASVALSAIDRVPRLRNTGGHAKEEFRNAQIACREHAYKHGIDSPKITGWRWPLSLRQLDKDSMGEPFVISGISNDSERRIVNEREKREAARD